MFILVFNSKWLYKKGEDAIYNIEAFPPDSTCKHYRNEETIGVEKVKKKFL